jgi:hypothetical protein
LFALKKALKTNFVPGLFLQCIALTLVLCYYFIASVTAVFDQVADLKTEYGYQFSALTTAIFAGFLPWTFMAARETRLCCKLCPSKQSDSLSVKPVNSSSHKAQNSDTAINNAASTPHGEELQNSNSSNLAAQGLSNGNDSNVIGASATQAKASSKPTQQPRTNQLILMEGAYLTLIWSAIGCQVDLLYRGQALIFGNEARWDIVVCKTLFDMFVFNPLWGCPSCTTLYLFKDCRFSFTRTWSKLNRQYFLFKIPSVLVSIWAVWGPACAIIYCLPGPLQVPLFNIVNLFWALILAFVSSASDADADE